MAFYGTRPSNEPPEPLTTRYVVVECGDGYAILMDRQNDTPVMTGTGVIYMAPVENAQRTAGTMNRTHSITPEAAPVTPEEEAAPVTPEEEAAPVTPEEEAAPVTPEEEAGSEQDENGAAWAMFTHRPIARRPLPRHARDEEGEEFRQYAQERIDRATDRMVELSSRVGQLEGELMNLRSGLRGKLAGLGGIPDSQDYIKSMLAMEGLRDLLAQVEAVVDTFPPVGQKR